MQKKVFRIQSNAKMSGYADQEEETKKEEGSFPSKKGAAQ
jgi:hypothetical protein